MRKIYFYSFETKHNQKGEDFISLFEIKNESDMVFLLKTIKGIVSEVCRVDGEDVLIKSLSVVGEYK